MIVYLARHASCVGVGLGVHEVDRYLTAEGRREALEGARRLARAEATPSVALTSPLARAVQTAELLLSALSFAGESRTHTALLPGADPAEMVDALRRIDGDVLLVGHAPDMRRRASLLLGKGCPPFAKGMIVALDVPSLDEPGTYLWAHLPSLDDSVDTLAELLEHRG